VALALPSGFAYRTYEIEALDPPTHTYTVRLVASGHPDLEVWLVSDVPLRVTDSTLPDPSCIQREMETVCEWPFPALEARPRGIWTVHILKKTDAPSAVRIAVLFEAVG
jgi:hypothetical protein